MGVLPNLQGPEPRSRGHVDTVPGVGGVPRPPGTQDGVVSHSDPRYLNHRNSAQGEEEGILPGSGPHWRRYSVAWRCSPPGR